VTQWCSATRNSVEGHPDTLAVWEPRCVACFSHSSRPVDQTGPKLGRQRAGLSEALTPAVRADVGEVKHPTALGCTQPSDGARSAQQLELGLGAHARNRPNSPSAPFPRCNVDSTARSLIASGRSLNAIATAGQPRGRRPGARKWILRRSDYLARHRIRALEVITPSAREALQGREQNRSRRVRTVGARDSAVRTQTH